MTTVRLSIPSSFEQSPEPPHIAIHARDHGRLAFVLIAPRFVGVDAVVGHFLAVTRSACSLVVGVGNRQRQVQEERTVLIRLDELEGFVDNQIVAVVHSLGRVPAGKSAVAAAHGLTTLRNGTFSLLRHRNSG